MYHQRIVCCLLKFAPWFRAGRGIQTKFWCNCIQSWNQTLEISWNWNWNQNQKFLELAPCQWGFHPDSQAHKLSYYSMMIIMTLWMRSVHKQPRRCGTDGWTDRQTYGRTNANYSMIEHSCCWLLGKIFHQIWPLIQERGSKRNPENWGHPIFPFPFFSQ